MAHRNVPRVASAQKALDRRGRNRYYKCKAEGYLNVGGIEYDEKI